ncbi:MAG: glycosyltransferase family 8 protein [Clostridia bacterium]|nr:glycosyltransferase family 8 protein [Clostridia bacterium]
MIKNEKAKNIIPIFYACDDCFVKYTIVSIKSLIDNADCNRNYIIHILNADISEQMKNETLKLETGFAKIKFVDVKAQLDKIGKNLPLRDYYSKTTYFRMFIADMFPEYKKALYIDSDTVILGDVSKLYDTELGDKYVGACHEQAMVQTEVYGNYVEQVMGIDRNNYFNAGILVINCDMFRKAQVMEQFIDLLGVYNFVVTQDEDYLNVICHNKVCWVDPDWNVEVYGQILVQEEDIKILHYIMVAKPWHFKDCQFKEYFWKYAKLTSVFQSIETELNEYTDEQRANDIASCDRLAETARKEANREDRFINVISKKKPQRSKCLIKSGDLNLKESLTLI